MHNFFATNLKYLREHNQMSKTDLSKKLNVHQSTISRWENEEMGATVENAYDVSEIFNVPMSELIGKDLREKNNYETFDELELLFYKNKDILTDEDKEKMKFLIEKRKREIDKQLGEE